MRKAWESRAPRHRAVILVLAVVLGSALYVWLVQAAWRARVQLRTSVMTLRAQAARLDQQALEYGRLRAGPAASASPTDLRTLVQTRAGDAGLSRALTQIEATDANQVTVVFGALPYAEWQTWVASLQAQQVRLDSCRIEALSAPGLVSVTATFSRAKP
ncbi:MAG TPA: type II secretion system protein M [Burkholderiales bacterium]|nr:type II secretion system protein M [Burkholderiales bacterium]